MATRIVFIWLSWLIEKYNRCRKNVIAKLCAKGSAAFFQGWANTAHDIAVLSPINNKTGPWSNYFHLIIQTKAQPFKTGQYNSRQQGVGEKSVRYWDVCILLVYY
jgi:hypothetical protein